MSIEQHPQGIARYHYLEDNPIYYVNAFQFLGGDFYRAVLGYESVWDHDFEESLVKTLDYYLTEAWDKGQYYFENVKVHRSFELAGLEWKRGVKPRTVFKQMKRRRMKRGERMLVRVNRLDTPHHVDVEFSNGEIWTFSAFRYSNAKHNNHLKDINESKRRHTSANKSGKVRAINEARGYIPPEEIYPQLYRLRQRLRRSFPL